MRPLARECGYSLIEVLVAVVILSIAILPMVSMFDSALRATRSTGDYDTARSLAAGSLEEVRALDYRSAATRYGGGSVPCSQGRFECDVSGTFVGADLKPEDHASRTRMLLTVEVRWDEEKSYRTSTLVAADEP